MLNANAHAHDIDIDDFVSYSVCIWSFELANL